MHFSCRKQLNANSVTASKVTSGFQESRKERVILIFKNKDEFNLLYYPIMPLVDKSLGYVRGRYKYIKSRQINAQLDCP